MKKKLKKYRISDMISVLGLIMILYGFAIALIVTPDKEYSEDENRYLQTFPKFSFSELLDGKYTPKITKYCSDQMPLRNAFVGLKAASETVLLKSENNGVIMGRDGYIIAKDDYAELSVASESLSAVSEFAENAGVPVHIAVAGRSQDVLTSYMPSLYPAREVSDKVFSEVSELSGDTLSIDLLTPLRTLADDGEYVYYRTDHHWTTLGAYYAYREIMTAYGMEAYPLEYFTRETVSEEFYGTTWSKAGMKWVAPDSMEFFRYEGDETLTCEIADSGKVLEGGLYDRSYLEKKDKYSAFIGGNNSRVRITDNSGERETLILIKDSFGHSLAPFLALHFDLEIIDLRYYNPLIGDNLTMTELIAEKGASRVLILYNMDSILTSRELANIAIEKD